MSDQFYASNGINLHVVEHTGTGPTLLLTPGLTANAHFFDAVVAAGISPPVRVLAVDLRGRGLSDKPDSSYTMEEHAADILGLLDEVGVDRVALGGHSFGGLLTYFLAANHPQRVERCVILDAPAEVDPGIIEQIRPSLERLEKTVASWEDYLAAVRAQPYYDNWWDPRIEAYYRADVEALPDGSLRSRSRPEHIQRAVQGTLEIDWPDTVSRIRQPVLLVRATDAFGPPGSPPILPADKAAGTLELLRDGRLIEVEGNHITAFFGEDASGLATHIRDFVLEGSG